METAGRMIPIETAESDLRRLLEQLQLGKTVTLVGSSGVPEALLVSLKPTADKPTADKPMSMLKWEAKWDDLVGRVDQAWKSEKSALETLVEMRRL